MGKFIWGSGQAAGLSRPLVKIAGPFSYAYPDHTPCSGSWVNEWIWCYRVLDLGVRFWGRAFLVCRAAESGLNKHTQTLNPKPYNALRSNSRFLAREKPLLHSGLGLGWVWAWGAFASGVPGVGLACTSSHRHNNLRNGILHILYYIVVKLQSGALRNSPLKPAQNTEPQTLKA